MATVNVTSESHLDHGIPGIHQDYILMMLRTEKATVKVGSFTGFLIAEVSLPESLAPVPCALIGPLTGESPIPEADVFYAKRGNRPNDSRLVRRAPTKSRTVTAIVSGGTLATMYGGPLAPQEPGDPYLSPENVEASKAFWSQHALSAEAFGL